MMIDKGQINILLLNGPNVTLFFSMWVCPRMRAAAAAARTHNAY